ncbi:hypothetical protein SY88_02610 [Clostridiales bacterium PH28_bin88]|nr:hypothetical protein SY88_02610 [Clostridiales bacterium PH28_bin88]
MTSFFSWMDYSEHERRQVLDVIDMFNEQDTRDELGIGTVRDAFADMLFPGTSTIQTRARYFLFVPWTYLELERLKVPSNQIAARARREEVAVIEALAQSEDQEGIIGIQARAALKRLPSNVYWQGLGRWGIRLFAGSQDQYHRSLDVFYGRTNRRQRNDDGEPFDGAIPKNWHAGLPPRPEGFPKEASFSLSKLEAEYFRERIMARAPGALLAFLVEQGEVFVRVPFPWEHHLVSKLPAHNREQLQHARNFSETIHGAALLYNLMLAELAGLKDLSDEYNQRLQDWALRLAERVDVLSEWDRRRFWEIVFSSGARIPIPTRRFIDAWLDLVLIGDVGRNARSASLNDDARQLIHERERSLKHGQARLDNRRALEIWNGAAGTAQLNYRWRVAQTILLDILAGLKGGDDRA